MLVLLLTAVGYFCAAKGWMGDREKRFLSKFVMNIAVPCMCVYSLRSRLTMDLLRQAGIMLLVPFFCVALSFVLAGIAGKIMKLPRRTLGVFMMMCGLSNTLFIGYPICTEIFGDESVPFIMMYYLVSTCFTQLVGLSLVQWAGDSLNLSGKLFLKFLKTPAVIGTLIAVLLVVLDIQLPDLAMSFGKYMNNVVTPLALLITGQVIYSIGLKNLRFNRVTTVVSLFRFLIAPGICFALCQALGVGGMGRNVFIIQSAMPVVTQTVVAAAEYRADEESAAEGAALTTILSFAAIPVWTVLLT